MRFYATFGVGHTFGNSYVAIDAESEDEARDGMFASFDKKWAFIYPEKGFIDDVARRWDLYQLCTIAKDSSGYWRAI